MSPYGWGRGTGEDRVIQAEGARNIIVINTCKKYIKIIMSHKGGHEGQVKHNRKAGELIGNTILKYPRKLSWQVDRERTFGLLKSKGFWENYLSKQLIL